jgi:hypothetical protein
LADKNDGAGAATQETQAAKTPNDQQLVEYWIKELAAAEKREKKYREKAKECVKIYEGDTEAENSYNILYANTETLHPALYSRRPRPLVTPRQKSPVANDPLVSAAAKVTLGTLNYLIDSEHDDYETFDALLKSAVLEALVPGRGVTRWKYDSKVEKDKKGNPVSIAYEMVCGEHVTWNRFKHGYGKQWKDVPWVSYDHFMTAEELIDNFGKDIANKVQLGSTESESEEGKELDRAADNYYKEESQSTTKLAYVAEIWDKVSKRVLFISPTHKDGPLKVTADPLKLTGFFPQPKPMMFLQKIKTLVPTPLYKQYEQQARELNRVCIRINRIIVALKVRGVYDGRIKELEGVFKADDNVMTPAESMEAMGPDASGLDKAIWMMPIDKLITVLQQLYLQRQQVKQVIYELTGIADIMRGSSQASETLGAQEIKERWGGVRLKRMQREAARYANDCLRIMAEISTRMQEGTIKQIVGLPYPTAAEKQKVQQQFQALQLQAQQTGQQLPPQQVQQAQQQLAIPSYAEILQLLKSDQLRSYKVDIETNSTVDLEVTEDKQDVQEMITATGQFMQGIAPLIMNGSLPFAGAKAMLVAICKKFRFGDEVEDIMKSMQPPAPPNSQPNPADMAKVKILEQESQHDQQLAAAKHQHEQQVAQGKMQLEQQKMQLEHQRGQQQLQQDLQLQREKLAAEVQLKREEHMANQVQAEKDGQRQRSIDRNKEQQDSAKLLKEMSGILANYEKMKQDGKADQQAQATDATMKALLAVVEKLAGGHDKPRTMQIKIDRGGDASAQVN